MAKILDLAGIGVGPFNLSLAALSAPVTDLCTRFFDQQPKFDWHPGMLLPGSRMQTSFLKDLVTPIDPTSQYSFLSYLVHKGRFYRFLNADFPRVHRNEFADYMAWVAAKLPNLRFDHEIREVFFDPTGFRLCFENGRNLACRNLVVANGLTPAIPSWARQQLGKGLIHSHTFLNTKMTSKNLRVAIIGGGQSGAEIFLDLISERHGEIAEVIWISRRPGLDPLDETAFTNEYFSPGYVRHFHSLPQTLKPALVKAQKLTGDGVSPTTLQELSQSLYEHDFLKSEQRPYRIMTHRDVRRVSKEKDGFQMQMHNGFTHTEESVTADLIILATGYRYAFPRFLGPIADRISRDEEGYPLLNQDYSAVFDGPSRYRLYMQNAGRNSHGIADAQLSLAAWRSAVIINSLLGREIYNTDACSSPLQWFESPSMEKPAFKQAM